MKSLLLFLSMAASAFAQDIRIPVNIQNLEQKAAEVTEVNLDGPMLKLAGRFMDGHDADERQALELIRDLKGIYVRSFEFDEAGEYSMKDVEEVRAQLKAPLWQRMVSVRSKRDGEDTDVLFKIENGEVVGLAIIDAEPKELTIVNIVGHIKPAQISELGGHFGVPQLDVERKPQKGGTQ